MNAIVAGLIKRRRRRRRRADDSLHDVFCRRRSRIAAAGSTSPFSSPSALAAAGSDGGCEGPPSLPVLIVGAGPVGLVLSFLLTKLGIKCAVLEKNTTFSRHPKPTSLTIDLWRSSGNSTAWRKTSSGRSRRSIYGANFDRVVSPVSVAHFSQYKLVELLLKKLENSGVRACLPDEIEALTHEARWEGKILTGHECNSIRPIDDGLIVGASYSDKGKAEERNFRCKILVGSDGARSTVRKLVGIAMRGESDLQKLVSVHFLSKDLGDYLLNRRPGMLFFIFNPEAIGVLVAHDLKQGEFVLQIPYYPPQQNFEDFSSKVCEQIIFKLVGWEPADVQVVDIKSWVMHAEVAEKYVSCNNRVILVGDAAHRFPPAGGFGMNTGIQDAHNLAWKICSLLSNISSPSILQTYETERRPIAISNTALSVENFKAAMSVPSALGLDPTIANSGRVINNSLGSIMPRSFQKVLLEGIFSIGRAQLSDFILNEKNLLGSLRLERLKSILDEGKSLQLQFPAEDLGFRYREGALVADSHDFQETEATSDRKRVSREYIPSAKTGCRLPHFQVRAQTASSSEETLSTLDLVPGDKLEFVLIIAPVKESYDLVRVILRTAEEFKVSVKVCIIWPQGSFVQKLRGSRVKLDPWENFIDVEEVKRPSSTTSWWIRVV
uniref:FAD-binding domain-containing protein n=1 Tax=Ananas comosus var. bracteatus TaxID=296719 RepID=A0A6V7QS98_ANACO